jgi:hypothetical protein
MATRLPASQRTHEELTALIEGWLSTASAKDELAGHHQEIQAERDRKPEAMRQQRRTAASGPRDADYLRFADDSGAVPLNPLKMKL